MTSTQSELPKGKQTKSVLIAGASGLVGSAALEYFLSQPDWEVIAISRRKPEIDSHRPFKHISVDLRDEKACNEAFKGLSQVTHIVFAALYEKSENLSSGWFSKEQIETNGKMLRHVIDPIFVATKGHIHAIVMHGAKAYGFHLPPPHINKIPARESDPRDDHPSFYWVQEDYIRSLANNNKNFTYTFIRPAQIFNASYGSAMSLLPVFGAYAAICRELNKPFGFPGSPARNIYQVVDARLLARMIFFAATSPTAVNETFNSTNGDFFTWHDLWKSLAQKMGMEVVETEPCSMSSFLPAQEEIWSKIVAKYHLKKQTLKEMLQTSDQFADLIWGPGETEPRPLGLLNDIKRHQAGFHDVADSEEVACELLQKLIDRHIIPPAIHKKNKD